MNTITAIYEGLQRKQSPVQLSLINTRVMLETGINLRNVPSTQNSDPTTVNKIVTVLRGMGLSA